MAGYLCFECHCDDFLVQHNPGCSKGKPVCISCGADGFHREGCPSVKKDFYCWQCKKSYAEGHCPVHFVARRTLGEKLAAIVQNAPVQNDRPAVWDLVMADMKSRDDFGLGKYGTRLQPDNGRDALTDLYQELLDACVYTRQMIYERDGK